MALYTDTVMDHFLHPRNVGEIADADGVGEVRRNYCRKGGTGNGIKEINGSDLLSGA